MPETQTDEKPRRDKHHRARNGRFCRRHGKPYRCTDDLTTDPKENR